MYSGWTVGASLITRGPRAKFAKLPDPLYYLDNELISKLIYGFNNMIKNIGFVSTRFAGTDGVSLESSKWADVFEDNGHRCFWFAGEVDRDPKISFLVPEAHFQDEQNLWIICISIPRWWCINMMTVMHAA